MFSTTTIESSTSKPSATTIPTIVSPLSVKPVHARPVNAIASDSGIEIMTTAAALGPSGSRVKSTSPSATRKSSPKRPSACDTFAA